MSSYQPEKVAQMYDSLEDQGETAILLDQYHLGYWDETNPNASITEAADRLTQIMINKVTIQAGERFCDLGCGVGMPAIQLAKRQDVSLMELQLVNPSKKRHKN
jgi:cyclopropane fatty-acyl-phospholipid synthase-like methyltransferase